MKVFDISRKSILNSCWWFVSTLIVWENNYWPHGYFEKLKIRLFCNARQKFIFVINIFEIRTRKDKHCHGGGLIELVREGFIYNRLTHLKPNNLESVSSELTIFNEKWIYFIICRPPSSQNIDYFFTDFSDSVSRAHESYKNLFS